MKNTHYTKASFEETSWHMITSTILNMKCFSSQRYQTQLEIKVTR